MAELIATTAAHGAPKALRKKLSRVLRHQLFAVGGALGEGVGTAMVAQGRDTLRDDRLQEASARKAHAAHAKVMQFAAEEKAKAAARHQEWEATARKQRDAIVKKSRAKAAAHARLLQQVHKEQNSHLAVLKGIEARDEHTLKALQVQRAKLLSVSGGHDATLMNQGARMTRLFAAKNTAQVLREDYITDCARGVARWNKAIEKAGIDFELKLPSKRFHRQIGTFADGHFDVDGNLLDDATWAARRSEWLPSEEDEAYVISLMKPVTEHGKIASWIAPPRRGINGNPFDFEYVRPG